MDVVRLAHNEFPLDSMLLQRVVAGRLDRTVEFLAVFEGHEAGLLVFDHWPSNGIGIVHEIYVLPMFAGRGIGKKLLAHAQNHATNHNCSVVQVTARSLDATRFSDEELVRWYGRHGFKKTELHGSKMEKRSHSRCAGCFKSFIATRAMPDGIRE